MKATDDEVLAAVDGEICPEQAEKLRIIRSHMDSLEACRLNTESVILALAEKYIPQINLITTVSGIQTFAAIGILSEIGADMSVFQTSGHLCSWAGLTPQNNESAGKKKTTRISRAGAYIKPLLVQCALCAIRAKSNPEIRRRYLSIKKRRGHKKAIIAIARMLLTAIYNILKKMSHTIRSFTLGVTTLRRNTGRFPWRRLSLFCKGKGILLPPALLNRN